MGSKIPFLFAVIFLFVISCSEYAIRTPEMHIIGNVPHARDSSFVVFDRFSESDASNHFLRYDSVPIVDGFFKKDINCSGSGVIVLASSEAIPSIHLICDGGGEIQMTIKRSLPYFDVTFIGKNAMGHDLIFDSSLLRVIHLTNLLNGAIEKGTDSPLIVIQHTERILDSLISPFDDLLKSELITPTFHHRLKTQAEGKMLSAVHYTMAHAYRYPKASALNKEAIDTILAHFFNKYDPFSNRYRFNLGINRTVNAEEKCRLIARGMLTGSREELGIWPSTLAQNSYAPVELQEKMLATQLILSRNHEENSICEDFKRFQKFKNTFPKSAYNSMLQTRYFDGLNCDDERVEQALYPFVSLRSDSIVLIAEYQDNRVVPLVRERFRDKKIFVDLWATWCAPCIQEFGFIDELKPALDRLGIEALYVSLDPLRARMNWENAIQKYRLEGSHFMNGKTIDSNLRALMGEKVEIIIPRYLLFDGKGRLLDGNLPRPSSGKLIERLQELSKS